MSFLLFVYIFRPNVFLKVLRRPPSTGDCTIQEAYQKVVDLILKDLQNEGSDFGKTIVFVSLKWSSLLHQRAVKNFDQTADAKELTCLMSQFHAPHFQQVN